MRTLETKKVNARLVAANQVNFSVVIKGFEKG